MKTYRTYAWVAADGEVQLDFLGPKSSDQSQLDAVRMWTDDPDWLTYGVLPWFPVEVEFDETL